MKLRALVVLFGTLAFMLTGCGDDDDDVGAGTDDVQVDEGGDASYTVRVDGRPDDTPMFFLAYFPNTLQAHAGDTIEFEFADTGEPHTASAGALIDNATAIFESSGFDPEGDAPPPPELDEAMAKIPFVFPDGPPEQLNQGAAQPCFATSEPVPVEEPCTEQEQVAFDGTQTFWNSGFVPGGESYEMALADDLAVGSYTIMCAVHGPEMTLTLDVVDAATDVPSPDEVEEAGQSALDDAVAELEAVADDVRASTDAAAAPAGGFSEEATVPGGAAVFPENIEIAEGESVTWNIFGPHTVSFNAPESAKPIVVVDADGTVSLNREAGAPAGWEGPPPPPEEESEEPPPPFDAGTFSGEGFHSSSVLFDPMSYKVTFDTAGTYDYVCLVHPDMEGRVTVT